jgi:predicted transcriptional regulator YheO
MKPETKSRKRDLYRVTKLSACDKSILDSLKTVTKGIAEIFGSKCEVVLHSLEDPAHSIIDIENGYITGREIGSPLTDLAMEVLEKSMSLENDVIGSYYVKTDDGRPLKSVTVLIRGISGKPIAFMCINIDLTVTLLDIVKEFSPVDDKLSSMSMIERFPSNLDDLVQKSLDAAMTGVSSLREVSPSDINRMVVSELYRRGIFNVKGAIDVVAKQIGISRYTVYNYIRDARMRREDYTVPNIQDAPKNYRH